MFKCLYRQVSPGIKSNITIYTLKKYKKNKIGTQALNYIWTDDKLHHKST